MMTIRSVDTSSPAALAGIQAGERLIAINGLRIRDELDYRFYSSLLDMLVETHSIDNKVNLRLLRDVNFKPLGLNFESDQPFNIESCSNNCVFCFVDQLPAGLRDSLYIKDDDATLSFLHGAYITLTNLSDIELFRIIAFHISPLRVSIHTTNPQLRAKMMGNPNAANILAPLTRLSDAGIDLRCQIVVCPGLNDGVELERTLRELPSGVSSVSVVPVGLTKHRRGLPYIKPVHYKEANEIIDIVERVNRKGAYCSDELFLKARRPIPPVEYYDDFPQYENGVGMLARFEHDFIRYMRASKRSLTRIRSFSIATGTAAAPMFERILARFPAQIFAIHNSFFGKNVDVAGLVTGRDLINQVKGSSIIGTLYIPAVMLRHEGDLFLDGVSYADVSSELGVRVKVVDSDGAAFAKELLQY